MELTTNATTPSPDPPPAAINTSPTNRTSSEAQEGDEEGNNKKEEWVKKMRGWLMVLTVLSASVTYQAGLNPPGGFWQDDLQSSNFTQGHTAGNPVLATKNPIRYGIFFSFNASAFVMSLIIIVLLLKPSFFHEELRLNLLRNFLVGNIISLVVAFAVGCSHDLKSSGASVLSTIFISILYVKWEVWRSERKMLRRRIM
ncbi:Caskin/Ankyrin repeat-containing protein [Dioscorea alata]|uniref:Caskin/Ankyrin repeat-containing protein n=1 Tax=Dioscorea alata TaxID=55571 RepID=A0ACB7WL80_DIOAL|nr:Caskin/Ankyrin repeat-containing protein [Dioscorea alata]